MTVYRLAVQPYKVDLSGTGAKLYGGRWNSEGTPMLYTTENISLCVLEILVRTGIDMIPANYFLVKIDIPDSININTLNKDRLKKDWKTDNGFTRWIGDEFIKSNKGVIMKIPSAIVDEEHNFILNPEHGEFKKIHITSIKKFTFDKRLYLKNE
jgi:RES domain-containing protein